jgi:hypothetical protein
MDERAPIVTHLNPDKTMGAAALADAIVGHFKLDGDG